MPPSTRLWSPPIHKHRFAVRAGQVTLPDTMGGASWEKQDAAAPPARVKSALLGNRQQLRPLPHAITQPSIRLSHKARISSPNRFCEKRFGYRRSAGAQGEKR